ncbi:hypothetical protein NFI96_017914, partial [Prochilodus magdalenae]
LANNEPRVPKRPARSAPAIITRRNGATSGTSELKENIDKLMERIQSMKGAEPPEQEERSVETELHPDLHPSQSTQTSSRTEPSSRAATDTTLSTYLNVLSSLYSIYEPALVESFVCVLADRTQCGWQADLTTLMSSRLSGPVLSLLSSLKSQTCSSSFSGSTRMVDSTLALVGAFQELATSTLSANLPIYLSPNFLSAWNSFIDLTLPPVVSFISENFLQTFVEFLTVGLEIGMDIPSLDQTQQCQQDPPVTYKSISLRRGMKNNLSWAFGDSILNMFLALDTPACDYTDPACQTLQPFQLGRSSTSQGNSPTTPLACNQQDVAHLNETFCADILANASKVPDALYGLCKALSSLSHSELIQVWKNTCQMVQLVIGPLLEPCPPLPSEASQRVVRSTLSLSQLFCNYENWTTVETIDPGLVTMCSDNDPEAFLQGVCNNVPVMQTLIVNPSNEWVWAYCANASDQYMIRQYCVYELWTPQTVDPSIVALCWSNDQLRMETLLCQSLDFYMVIFSAQENDWLKPNCAEIPTTPPVNIQVLVAESCRYSEWRNIRTITIDQISLCIQNDEIRFVNEVCTNNTLLATFVNMENAWVKDYCTISLSNPPTSPPVVSSSAISPTTPLTSSVSVSSTATSNTTPPSFSSSISNYTLSPTKTPTDLPGTSAVPLSSSPVPSSSFSSALPSIPNTALSPTAPLTYTSADASVISSTKVFTVTSVASSITLFPSASPAVSPTNSILSQSSTSPLTILPTVSRSTATLSASPTVPPTVPPTSTKVPLSSYVSTSSSAKISATVSSLSLAPVNSQAVLPTISSTVFPTILPTASSTTPSPTTHPTVPSISDWCKYVSWGVIHVDPSVVGLCWQLDTAGFYLNVCCNMALFEHLTLDPQNQWLKSICSDNNTKDLPPQVCLYSDWSQPTIVDMADLALCVDLDAVNFTKNVCNNTTVLQNLLANLDNTWLLEQCSNLTGGAGGGKGGLMGFVPSVECQYASWAVTLPDAALLALCWDYDQTNFLSSVCSNPAMLLHITQEPSSLWVSTLCTTYSNYTRTTTQSNTTNSGDSSTSGPSVCLVKELIDGLNWSCSVDVSTACKAEVSQLQGLQVLVQCGMEVLLPHLQTTLSPQVASIVRQATSVWVVLLLVLEENEMTTLRVTDNIRQNVLDSVSAYLDRESNFDNKQVLLQCFGKVLTGLMQTGRDVASIDSFLIKEYFRIPLASLKAVFSSVDVSTMRQILQYFSRNQANLQLTEEYMHTMVNILIHVQLRQDVTLFFDLSPLLSLATPEDISSLPPLQNDVNVLNIINSIINNLSLEQRQAFGWWYSQSVGKGNMTAGGLSFIRDHGNLIAYLPFNSFQYLTPAQLLDGLDVLLRNDMGPLKQQFVAQSVIGGYKNLTADQFRRLATWTCQANQNDLLAYMNTDVSPVIQENIRTCVAQGISVPSSVISSLFLNQSDVQSPSSLSPQRISQLAQFLPLMGLDFLQQLSPAQLLPVLSVLTSVPVTPLQLSESGSGLTQLKFLASGVSVEAVWGLPSDALLTGLSNFSQYAPQLTPPQAAAISTKLWGVSSVVTWLKEVEPLLPSTPLLSVMPRTRLLLTNSSSPYKRSWNTQQAKTLFTEALASMRSLSALQFMSLGTVAQGVSCKALAKLIQNSPSVSSMSDVLGVLRGQPVPLHPSLKRCVIEELYKLPFFSELLGAMGAEIALSIPMSTIKKFSVSMTDTLRTMIVQDPQYFLLMPITKQTILVDKIVQRLSMHTGTYTEEEFRSLGVMATFVVDEVFLQLDRSFLVVSVEFLRGFCYSSSKRDIVASMLQEPSTFGGQRELEPFFLQDSFASQRQWESGEVVWHPCVALDTSQKLLSCAPQDVHQQLSSFEL